MADSNCQIVQTALLALQHRGGTFPAELFSPLFRVRSCGARMDLEGLRLTWRERQSLVREVGLKVVDTIARADQVAVVRRGMVRAADGSQTQLCVIDVWRLEGGLIVEGEQCWNRLAGPAADDMPLTAKEGANAESVRLALASLQDLRGVQASLRQHWAPGFRGRVNGLALDLEGLCRHWSELQAKLSTVLVQVEELVAQGSGVGVVYRLLAGKRDIFRSRSFSRSLSRGSSSASLGGSGGGGVGEAGGGAEAGAASAASSVAELRVIAVFHLDSEGRIDRSAAVCEVVSGHSGDEALATAMPAEEEMAAVEAEDAEAFAIATRVTAGISWLDDSQCWWIDPGVRADPQALLAVLGGGGVPAAGLAGPPLVLKSADTDRVTLTHLIEQQITAGRPAWRAKLFHIAGSDVAGARRQRHGGGSPGGVRWLSRGFGGRVVKQDDLRHQHGSWTRVDQDGRTVKFLGRKTTLVRAGGDEPDPNALLIHIRVSGSPDDEEQEGSAMPGQGQSALRDGQLGSGGAVDSVADGIPLGGLIDPPLPGWLEPAWAGGEGLQLLASAASVAGAAGTAGSQGDGRPTGGSAGRPRIPAGPLPLEGAAVGPLPTADSSAGAARAAVAADPHNLWAGLSDGELAGWLARELREPLPLGRLVQALLAQLGRSGLADLFTAATSTGSGGSGGGGSRGRPGPWHPLRAAGAAARGRGAAQQAVSRERAAQGAGACSAVGSGCGRCRCAEAACLRMRRAARAGRPPEWVAQEHPCCNRLCLMCMRARRAEWRADRQQERRQTLMVRRNGWRSCTHSHGPRRRLHEGLRAAPRRSYDAIRLALG